MTMAPMADGRSPPGRTNLALLPSASAPSGFAGDPIRMASEGPACPNGAPTRPIIAGSAD